MNNQPTHVVHVDIKGVLHEAKFSPNGLEVTGSDGSYSRTNTEHWYRVVAERAKHNVAKQSKKVSGHPLIGKWFYHKASGEHFKVEYVLKNWSFGQFLTATLVNRHGSHAVVYLENVSCRFAPWVDKSIEQFKREYQVVEADGI